MENAESMTREQLLEENARLAAENEKLQADNDDTHQKLDELKKKVCSILEDVLKERKLLIYEIERLQQCLADEKRINSEIEKFVFEQVKLQFSKFEGEKMGDVVEGNKNMILEFEKLQQEAAALRSKVSSLIGKSKQQQEEINRKKDDDGHDKKKVEDLSSGSLTELVGRMTSPNTSDTSFLTTFLLTYRAFTTPREFILKLFDRYGNIMQSKEGESADSSIIRIRVRNILKVWINKHFYDLENDQQTTRFLLSTMEQYSKEDESGFFEKMREKIHQKIQYISSSGILVFSEEPPPPILPTKGQPSFSHFDPLEIARQMTILEYMRYRRIQPRECLNQQWNLKDKEKAKELAPHIFEIIHLFNTASKWVAWEILNQEKVKERAHVIKKFIRILECLLELNNFHGIMEIIAGLRLSPIHRLKATWAKVESSKIKVVEDMSALMHTEGSYKAYRSVLHSCQPPCVPYVGVFLQDMTFIEDGNRTFIADDTQANEGGEGTEKERVVNFEKMRRLAKVIQDIQQFQQTPYCLKTVDVIMHYLTTFIQQLNVTEDEFYEVSYQLEPRAGTAIKKPPT